jgi:small subunit ribosomal protein S17
MTNSIKEQPINTPRHSGTPLKRGTAITARKFSGVVVSDKMTKTIVVKVERVKVHPKYGKRYTVSAKYKVHDEKGDFHIGDKVNFVECRPLSRDKRWRVLSK